MRTFLAAFLGFLAAGVLLVAGLLLLGHTDLWLQWARRSQPALARTTVDGEAARRDAQKRLTARDRADQESQHQRRERLALLTATLRRNPIADVAAAETHLFQAAERERARASSGEFVVRLLEPVQIDEQTVLERGTEVEFGGFERDNVITMRHDGASYQLSPCQTDLRAIAGDVCSQHN